MRVIGDAAVTVCVAKGAGKPAAADEYGAGSLLDLVQLRRAAANRSAREPFPPAKPPAPVVAKGTLVIVGGGGSTPEIWERFIKASGGTKTAQYAGYLLGTDYEETNNAEKARQTYERALGLFPGSEFSSLIRGRLKRLSGQKTAVPQPAAAPAPAAAQAANPKL